MRNSQPENKAGLAKSDIAHDLRAMADDAADFEPIVADGVCALPTNGNQSSYTPRFTVIQLHPSVADRVYTEVWYVEDTLTGDYTEHGTERDAEIECAIREAEHIRIQVLEKRQQRLPL